MRFYKLYRDQAIALFVYKGLLEKEAVILVWNEMDVLTFEILLEFSYFVLQPPRYVESAMLEFFEQFDDAIIERLRNWTFTFGSYGISDLIPKVQRIRNREIYDQGVEKQRKITMPTDLQMGISFIIVPRRKNVYNCIVDICLGLKTCNFNVYTMLFIMEWVPLVAYCDLTQMKIAKLISKVFAHKKSV